MPLTSATRLAIDELGSRFGSERAHGDRVADLALKLFDATHGAFGVPAEERIPLEVACLLHDLAYERDPRRHGEAGAAVLRRRGLAGLERGQVRRAAALIRLHPRGLGFDAARRAARRAPGPERLLYAAALLRIADALDEGHLQDTEIAAVRATHRSVRVEVRAGHFPAALDGARRQAALWRGAFPVDLQLRRRPGAPRPLFRPDTPVAEAARRLLGLQYRTLLLNVEGAVAGAGEEPLHDLRIAIRRMRVVLRAFRRPLGLDSGDRIERELQGLNRVLGLARDLDVWIGFFSTESVSRQFTRHRLWAGFVAHQLELRRLQQATVRRQLHGPRFTALRARVERFLRVDLPAAAAAGPLVPAERPARRALAKALRRCVRLGHLRDSRSPEKLHELRIALRRLRYLAAFLGPALGRPVRKLGKRAHAVERILGGMRDADLALARIRQEGPPPPRLLVRQLERLRRADAAELEGAWGRLEDPQFILEVRRELRRDGAEEGREEEA